MVAAAILSIRDLAARVGTPVERMTEIADDIEAHYRPTALYDAKRGRSRMLNVPRKELKALQQRIHRVILDPIELSACVHGAVRGRSPRTNAEQHLGKPCVICVDVKSFFDSVRHYVVYRMFRNDLGFGRDVARLLTRLTTYDSQLPQGAPTSPVIANLVLAFQVDKPLEAAAASLDLTYTRFVDDIAISGGDPRPLINVAAKLLSARRLKVHRATGRGRLKPKLKIMSGGAQQKITGLVVNSASAPTIPRRYRDQVRAAIHQLREMQPGASFNRSVDSIRGRIAHVRRLHPSGAARLAGELARVIENRRECG